MLDKIKRIIEELKEMEQQSNRWNEGYKINLAIADLEAVEIFCLMKEKYNISIKVSSSHGNKSTYYQLEGKSDRIALHRWHNGCQILNSKPQPENDRWLICISFSIGAYIFGEDYDYELFEEFYEELKSYKCDFSDDTNKEIYFYIENAHKILNDYDGIYEKYINKHKERLKQKEKEELRARLAKLESEE